MQNPEMKLGVVLPAAGSGTRFAAGGGGDKLAVVLGGRDVGGEKLGGRSVLLRSAGVLAGRAEVVAVVVAVAPDEVDAFELRWGDRLRAMFVGAAVRVVAGGRAERWETVMKALEALPAECTHVAVHDAARPLGTSAMVERVVSAARTHPAVVPAVRVAATLKRVFQDPSHDGGELKRLRDHYEPVERVLAEGEDAEATGEHDLPVVVETIDRRGVWAAQTPQVFDAELLREVYGRVASGRLSPAGVTDDASLIELAGGTEVVLVEGEATNLKITEPGDAELAEAIVRMRDAEALAEAKDPLADLFDDEP